MDHGNRKPGEEPPDPNQLAKLLELELMQKRASWQQGKQRLGALRALSFAFLALVVVGASFAFWFFFSSGQVSDLQSQRAAPREASPSPTASP